MRPRLKKKKNALHNVARPPTFDAAQLGKEGEEEEEEVGEMHFEISRKNEGKERERRMGRGMNKELAHLRP